MNWPTIIILGIVIAVFAAIVIGAIRNKRKGKNACSCGGSCSGCAMSGMCHGKE